MRNDSGDKDIDYVLTTRELAKMLKQSNIDPSKLSPTPFDKVMSEGTGAAVIFGVTGGVMEAALRTAYEVITGRNVPFDNLNIMAVRGLEGVREAEIKLENVLEKYKPFEGFTIKIAVAHGPNNARKVMEIVKQAKAEGKPVPWHFIEIMACPGGCIGGGGQPKPTNLEVRQARTKLIYNEDMNLPYRKSHENPEVIELYKNYLKEPLGHNSHHYLHAKYIPNPVRSQALFNPDEARGIEEILEKYPKEQQYLLPIIIEENDKKGYISEPSLLKIAKHLNMYPAQVDSILSAYHYFPREHSSDTHVYFCTCHNCMMKGQAKVIRTIQEKYGLRDLHNSLSNDGKFTFHTLNWLGYCVNDAPAMMIKRTGTDFVEVMTGLSHNTIEERINALTRPKHSVEKWPHNNIREMSTKRYGKHYSILESNISLPEASKKAAKMGPEKVIQQVLASSLVGRGGAGFRTGIKWESAYKAVATDKYVVCNADEGLPSTYKDWCILNHEYKRKELITGMGICANVISAKKCYLYLRYEYRNLVPALEKAIAEVKNDCPELNNVKYEIRLGGGPYVAGEENALFESIQGAAPIPRRHRLPSTFPTDHGLFDKPTIINNVETFLTIPHIIIEGADAFGPGKIPKLLSVTGDVSIPMMMESSLKNYTLNQLLNEIHTRDIVAAEVGGSTEPIIFRNKFDQVFGFGPDKLNAVGSVVLFNSSCDFSEIYENKLKFMADESCKQCVPCRDGSRLFHRIFKELKDTGRTSYNLHTLDIAAESTAKSSICAHGKAVGTLFQSARDYVMARKPKH